MMALARANFIAFGALVGIGVALTSPHAIAAQPDEELVPMIGREGPALDACGGIGSISGYAGRAQRPLAVLERPEDGARRKDVLEPGTLVWLCDADGEWQGIVYASGEFQDLGDCRVGSPVAEPRRYDGPCNSGWVDASRIQLVTG